MNRFNCLMPLREDVVERVFVVLAAAVALMAADLWVKATIPTAAWHFHERSTAWAALCVLLLLGAWRWRESPHGRSRSERVS